MTRLTFVVFIFFSASHSCKTAKNLENKRMGYAGDTSASVVTKNQIITTDSVAYIRQFVADKEKYINKELGVLLSAIKIPVKSYSPIHNFIMCTGLYLSLDDFATTRYKESNINSTKRSSQIIVEFEKPVKRADIQELLKRSNGEWGDAEAKFYSKMIIKDIK